MLYTNFTINKELTGSKLQELLDTTGDQVYRSYAEALREGKQDQLLVAENGFAWKNKIMGSTRYWVFDYKWLKEEPKTPEAIKDYIKDHKVLMFLRGYTLSDKTVVGLVTAIFLGFLAHLLQQSIGAFYIWCVSWCRTKRKERKVNKRLKVTFQKPLFALLKMDMDESWRMGVMTALFSYIIAYCGLLNSPDIEVLSVVGIIYLGLVYLVVGMQVIDVLLDVREARKTHK